MQKQNENKILLQKKEELEANNRILGCKIRN